MNDIDSKRVQVLSSFKQRLRSGRWEPGSRLPTRTELVKSFKISPITLQLVIDDLMREGFVQSRGREGTFVAAKPPFTRNFGFVINGVSAERNSWVHYWRVLEAEATKCLSGSDNQPVFYYGIERPLSDDMTRLREDIEAQRLAGVFFTNVPYFLKTTTLLNQTHTPLVAVGSKLPDAAALSVITFANDQFFDTAMKEIVAVGRKRVGLLTPWEDPHKHLEEFTSVVKKYNLETHPSWCQYVPHSRDGRLWANNAVQAIIAGKQRPDALIIYDDNLIESAMTGLHAASCSVPNDCAVVAYTNFPWPIPSPYPLIRIGTNIRDVVSAAVTEINRRQHGETSKQIHMPLQIQNEL